MRSIPQIATDLIAKFESCRLEAYLDPVGIPTIGYGSTKNVWLGQVITQEQALVRLMQDLAEAANAVLRLIRAPINDNQYSSLISFCYNVGSGALQRSTMRMKINNRHYELAANEFLLWCRARGKVLPGLVVRRKAEKELFLT